MVRTAIDKTPHSNKSAVESFQDYSVGICSFGR